MQNAKDTFYEVLRGRIAAGNAERTVVIRGVVRPAVVVDENELVTAAKLLDCFQLRWVSLRVGDDGLAQMGCEIEYATAGSESGLDRGREMAALDAELAAALQASPQNAVKKDFRGLASGGAAVARGSRIWWSDAVFGALTVEEEELRRVVKASVWSYQKAGAA